MEKVMEWQVDPTEDVTIEWKRGEVSCVMEHGKTSRMKTDFLGWMSLRCDAGLKDGVMMDCKEITMFHVGRRTDVFFDDRNLKCPQCAAAGDAVQFLAIA